MAKRDLGSEVAGLGAMLPDLWRMADRRMRARAGLGPSLPEGSDPTVVEELLRGIDHHLEADRWFHQHTVFLQGEANARRLFHGARIRGEKMGFFAHFAWELCLDGAFVRRQGIDSIRRPLGLAYEAARGAALRRVALHHRPRLEAEDVALQALETRIEGFLDSILEGVWISGYGHGRGVAYSLGRIRHRVGLGALDEAEQGRLAEVLDTLLDEAERRLPDLLEDS